MDLIQRPWAIALLLLVAVGLLILHLPMGVVFALVLLLSVSLIVGSALMKGGPMDPGPLDLEQGVVDGSLAWSEASALVPVRKTLQDGSLWNEAEYHDGTPDEDLDLAPLVEPLGLFLSRTFRPALASLLARTFVMVGMRRSGKSNGVAVICEELASQEVPLLICDTEDEYRSLVQAFPQGVLAGSPDLLVGPDQPDGSVDFIAVDREGASEFGWMILECGLQVVLNLQSYASDDEAALVMVGIIGGMNAWQEQHSLDERVPCTVVLEESSKWLPQQITESVLSRDVLILLQETFFGVLVRRGGKRGFGLGLVTQRFAELDKRALQSEWKFLFRQTEQGDLERYAKFGIDPEAVLHLQAGECFVWSLDVARRRVQFRWRYTPHGAPTPGLAQLHDHRSRRGTLDPDSVFAQRDLRKDQRQPESTPQETISTLALLQAPQEKGKTDVERALEAWEQGHQSVNKLEIKLNISHHKAYGLYRQLKQRRLI